MKHLGFLLIQALLPSNPALTDVRVPLVTGPVASPDIPGTACNDPAALRGEL